MKKSLVQTVVVGDNTYGKVSHPDDLMKAQAFVHDRISGLTHDFINNHRRQEVTGFPYVLGAGTAFTIDINRPGRVYWQDGVSFDLLADTELTIAPAHETMPRLDLVVAVLDDEINAELDLIPFVRLRTAEEFGDSVPPYPPSNLNQPKELHWRAVPQIKTGLPAAVPTPPLTGAFSNEVPLYLIAIAPGATSIREADVLDLRDVALTLRQLNEFSGQDRIDIAKLSGRVRALEKITSLPIDLSHIFGQIRTLGEILALLQEQLNSLRDVPEIRYANPKVPLTNIASSQIPAEGVLLSLVPSVQMEIGATVFFGNTEVPVLPHNFTDKTLNPRFTKIEGGLANVSETTDLSLENVTQIAADGFTDFVQRSAIFSVSRARPAAAARDSQFVEVFAGLASDNSSQLGDWLTYDTVNDTLTQREPSLSLASADRPAAFSCGDGVHVLLICGSENDNAPRVFKINGETAEVEELLAGLPTGVQFIGDLISDDIIFIIATRKTLGGFEQDFYEFDTGSNIFTPIGVTGSVPAFDLDYAEGCHYTQDQFVLVTFQPNVSSSGRTYVFNRPSLEWTELTIAPPYGDNPEKQLPLARFRMANVNGRPLLVGGLLTKDTDASVAKIWELTSSVGLSVIQDRTQWRTWDATFSPIQDPGFCSTLGTGAIPMPNAKAFLFAGHSGYSESKTHIHSSQQGGLIVTTFEGQPAITIADGSTFAQFIIDPYEANWDVAGYLMSLVGKWDGSNLKAEASFNHGDTWHEVKPDQLFFVTDSGVPGVRLLRITLYNVTRVKPVLSRLIEVFDEDGVEIESRVVIHYIAPVTLKYLYVNRDGTIELSDEIAPSTPDRCLIHKVIPNDENAPVVKNYINRRRAHYKLMGVGAEEIPNNLAVPVRYVDARAVDAVSAHLYYIEAPTVEFDEPISVTGLADPTDSWILEIEA